MLDSNSTEGIKNASLASQDTAVSPQLHSSTSRLQRVGLKDRVKKLIDNSQIKDKKALNDGFALLFSHDEVKKLPESVVRKLSYWREPEYRWQMNDYFKKRQELKNWEYLDDLTSINPFDFLTDKTDLKIVQLRKDFIKHLRRAVRQKYTIKEFRAQRSRDTLKPKKTAREKVESEDEEPIETLEDWTDPCVSSMLPFPDIASLKIRKKLDAQIRADKSEDFWTQLLRKDLYAPCPQMPSLAHLYKKMAEVVEKGTRLEQGENKFFTEDAEAIVVEYMADVIRDLVTNSLLSRIVNYLEEEVPDMIVEELSKSHREDDVYPGGMSQDEVTAMSQRVTDRILSEIPKETFAEAVVRFVLLRRKNKFFKKFFLHLNRRKPVGVVNEEELDLLKKVIPSDLNDEFDYLRQGIANFLSIYVTRNLMTGLVKTEVHDGNNDTRMMAELRRQGDEMLKKAKQKKVKKEHPEGARFTRHATFSEGYKRHVLDVRVNQIIYGISAKPPLAGKRRRATYMSMQRLRQLLASEKEPKLVPYKPSYIPENIMQYTKEQSSIGKKEKGLITRLLKKLPLNKRVNKNELFDDDPLVVKVGDGADAFTAHKMKKDGQPLRDDKNSVIAFTAEPVVVVDSLQKKPPNDSQSTDVRQSKMSILSQRRASPTKRASPSGSILSAASKWKPPKERKLSYTAAEREEFGEEYFMDWVDEDDDSAGSSTFDSIKLGLSRTGISLEAVEKYPSKLEDVKRAPEPPSYFEWLSETYDPEITPSTPIRLHDVKLLRKKAQEFLEDKNDKLSWNETAVRAFVPPVSVHSFEPFEKLGVRHSRFDFKGGRKCVQPWVRSFHEKSAKQQLLSKKQDSKEKWLGPAFFEFPDPVTEVANSRRQQFSRAVGSSPKSRNIGPAVFAPPSTLKTGVEAKEARYRKLVKLTQFHRSTDDGLPPTLYDPVLQGTIDYKLKHRVGTKGPFYSGSERSPETLPGRFRRKYSGNADFILPDSFIQKMLKNSKYGKWTIKKKKLNEIVGSDDESVLEAQRTSQSADYCPVDPTKRRAQALNLTPTVRQNRAPFNSTAPRFVTEMDETGLTVAITASVKRHCQIPLRSPFKSKVERWNPAKDRQKYNIFE